MGDDAYRWSVCAARGCTEEIPRYRTLCGKCARLSREVQVLGLEIVLEDEPPPPPKEDEE